MHVLFDLRPQHLVHIQEQQVDALRLFIVLLIVAFVGLSLFNIGNITFRLRSVTLELAQLRSEQAVVVSNSQKLADRIAEMRALRDKIRAYLEFTRQELPTVEFMAALEGAVPSGLKVVTLDIRQGSVTMRGSGITDQDVMDFVARLDGMKNVITRVDAPVTTKSTLGQSLIIDFALSCNIRSISEIAALMPEAPIISTEGAAIEQSVSPVDGQAPAEAVAPQGEATQGQ